MHNNQNIILATGGYDHTIKLWKAETKDCIKSMQHPDSVSTHRNSKFNSNKNSFRLKINLILNFSASECIGSDTGQSVNNFWWLSTHSNV